MTHSVFVHAESEDRTDSTLTNIARAGNERFFDAGDSADQTLIPDNMNNILMVYFGQDQADDFVRARITAPTIAEAPFDFVNGWDGSTTRGQAASVYDFRDDPIKVIPSKDKTEILLAEAGGAVAVDAWGAVICGTNPLPRIDTPPESITHILSGTYSAGNTTALTWTRFTYSLNSSLPAGRYRMYGGQHKLTTGIAVRELIKSGTNATEVVPYPLLPIRHTSEITHPYNDFWGIGAEFPHDRIPAVELLTEAAEDPVDQGYELYLTKVA
jgi:hypothetical protein